MIRRIRSISFLIMVFFVIGVLIVGGSPSTNAAISTDYKIASPRIAGTPKGYDVNVQSRHAMSADGRYLVFTSQTTNLVPDDTNEAGDIFVRDMISNTTVRASVATDGTQSNGNSDYGSISYDGRYIVFRSQASNLVSGMTGNSTIHIYIHDMTTGETRLVDTSSSGAIGNGWTAYPQVSADGRFVVFSSHATNLISNIAYPYANPLQVYVKDMHSGALKLLSVTSSGGAANGDSINPDVSCDAGTVIFGSEATNLDGISLQGNRTGLVIANMGWNNVELSTTPASSIASTDSLQLSCDGNVVLFMGGPTDLVSPSTPDGFNNIYEYNKLTKVVTQVSLGNGDVQADGFQRYKPISASMSSDGRYVAFSSFAHNMDTTVPTGNDTGPYASYYLRDVKLSTTETLTIVPTGHRAAYSQGGVPLLNSNGSRTAFVYTTPGTPNSYRSLISGFTTGESSGVNDLYVTDTGH